MGVEVSVETYIEAIPQEIFRPVVRVVCKRLIANKQSIHLLPVTILYIWFLIIKAHF